MTVSWTEEQIAAHIDGALTPDEDAAIREALASDPQARAVAERIRGLNRLLGDAYPLPDADEMPAGIAGVLSPTLEGEETEGRQSGGQVVPLRPRNSVQRGAGWLPLVMAASVALAIGVGLGFGGRGLLSGPDGAVSDAAVLADAGPALEEALTTLASGSLSPAGIRPISTFRNADGRPCREFETSGTGQPESGIACLLPGGGWNVLALITLPDGTVSGPGFVTADGGTALALDTTLEAIGAGLPLAPATEAALIDSGWQ